MNDMTNLNLHNPARRGFIVKTALAGGGLALGFNLPGMGGEAHAQAQSVSAGAPELNAWVAIKSDDTVVIRIARSEMGQGTLTGLAQLVAEELDCDWNKVKTEHIFPGQSLARKRVWGDPRARSTGWRASDSCTNSTWGSRPSCPQVAGASARVSRAGWLTMVPPGLSTCTV